METEFAIIKLGKVKNVDFLKEHKKIIDKYGYVDFAWKGKRFVSFNTRTGTFYIKESANSKNRLIKATFSESHENDRHFPQYYSSLDLSGASWYRIETLLVVDRNDFLDRFTLRSGNDIKGLDSGAAPVIFIKKREGKWI